jgi:hypothetical protein
LLSLTIYQNSADSVRAVVALLQDEFRFYSALKLPVFPGQLGLRGFMACLSNRRTGSPGSFVIPFCASLSAAGNAAY